MSDDGPVSTLAGLRGQIDGIDDEILDALDRRARLAVEIARAKEREGKPSFYDPDRERRVVERLAARTTALPAASVRAVFREVISACLSIQRPHRIAYLGPEGTFSQLAAKRLFGDAAEYWDATTIDGVFDAVDRGDAARGVVPIENSSEGPVATTVRALLGGGLVIERELVLEVAQCLLTRATTLPAIKRVYSHPQALGQCSVWLRRNLPDVPLVQTPSTSQAVVEALADAEGAALGSKLASEMYAIPALCEGVQDSKDNATRFLVVAKTDALRTGDDKTSIAFTLADGPGALRRALESFEQEGISLTRIASHPSADRAWAYVFFCDLEGHRDDERVRAALARLEAACAWVKMLGSYPRFHAPRV